ncbi:unnamed protein product [Darwinula stevensoni]|uniref:Endonuclease/exonuclease/phosphatase domain-containing protein n=1 Tax=Darwinula stevensoni TaxID=69355 RepID=A0A7R9AFV6_9CRUS|nr:unnamed protein product [Darwinula stevensoni]CAG0903665.1 unnamed protein product [Darwinula stevensoni]
MVNMQSFRGVLTMLALGAACAAFDLKLATFNIKQLGDAKLDKPDVVEILLQILDDYDLVSIQELTDADGSCVPRLLDLLNEASGKDYTNLTSPRLGSSDTKEQYLILYRPSVVQVKNSLLYDDVGDDFEREPESWMTPSVLPLPPSIPALPPSVLALPPSIPALPPSVLALPPSIPALPPSVLALPPSILALSLITMSIASHHVAGGYVFTIGSIHTRPTAAVPELDHFALATDWVTDTSGVQEFILLGDFNADCDYVKESDWPNISLWTRQEFEWLVDHDEDTTANGNTFCAYDR